MFQQRQAAVVMVGNKFNLPIFKELWLLENNIIEKDEFGPESFFTPLAIQVPTPSFDLLIVAERLQVLLSKDFTSMQKIFQRVVVGIIQALPHTPVTGLGINFEFDIVVDSNHSFCERSKQLFVPTQSPFAEEFSDESSRYGSYLSKDAFGGRLRLDIKPVKLTEESSSPERIRLSFNLHKDIVSVDDIKTMVTQTNDVYQYTIRLTESLDRMLNTKLGG